MATRYGMIAEIGQRTYSKTRDSFLGESLSAPRDYSEQTTREIDIIVRDLVEQAFTTATDILTAHRDQLEQYAQALLEKETLTTDELPDIHTQTKPDLDHAASIRHSKDLRSEYTD